VLLMSIDEADETKRARRAIIEMSGVETPICRHQSHAREASRSCENVSEKVARVASHSSRAAPAALVDLSPPKPEY
jgi:hypothetical protein